MNLPVVDPAISLDIKKLLEDCGALLRGHFKLSSGLHSDSYVQCARLFEDPAATKLAAKLLKEKLLPRTLRPQAVVGPAMGGIIWGYQLAEQLNATSLFCERADGEFSFRRGFELKEGERVLVAEDVVTTGLSSREAIAPFGPSTASILCLLSLIGPIQVVRVRPEHSCTLLQIISGTKPNEEIVIRAFNGFVPAVGFGASNPVHLV